MSCRRIRRLKILKANKYKIENYKRDGNRMIAKSTRELTEMIEPLAQDLSCDGATIIAVDAALAVVHVSWTRSLEMSIAMRRTSMCVMCEFVFGWFVLLMKLDDGAEAGCAECSCVPHSVRTTGIPAGAAFSIDVPPYAPSGSVRQLRGSSSPPSERIWLVTEQGVWRTTFFCEQREAPFQCRNVFVPLKTSCVPRSAHGLSTRLENGRF